MTFYFTSDFTKFFIDLDEVEYNHGFDLKSAIDPRAMPFTNYTFDFKGMIDYIFYPRYLKS